MALLLDYNARCELQAPTGSPSIEVCRIGLPFPTQGSSTALTEEPPSVVRPTQGSLAFLWGLHSALCAAQPSLRPVVELLRGEAMDEAVMLYRHGAKPADWATPQGGDAFEKIPDPWLAVCQAQLSSTYLVDNSTLEAPTVGLGYRCPQNLTDHDGKNNAAWGSTICGIAVGEEWVKVGDSYLPVKLRRVVVLKRVHQQVLSAPALSDQENQTDRFAWVLEAQGAELERLRGALSGDSQRLMSFVDEERRRAIGVRVDGPRAEWLIRDVRSLLQTMPRGRALESAPFAIQIPTSA